MPIVATRHESHKEMLGSDPAFSQSHHAPHTHSYDPTDYNQHGYGQQAYAQPAYTSPPQPAYTEHNTMNPPVDQSYAERIYVHREGVAPSLPASKPRKPFFAFMSSKWAAIFMAVTLIQAVVCLCFEA